MSKFEPLWQYLANSESDSCKLSFEKIKEILGFEIDRSFLTYKREVSATAIMYPKFP